METTTGFMRHIDELGRILIPKEIRSRLGIHELDQLEISSRDNEIIIRRATPKNATDYLKEAIEVIDDNHADLINLLSMIIKVLDDDKR